MLTLNYLSVLLLALLSLNCILNCQSESAVNDNNNNGDDGYHDIATKWMKSSSLFDNLIAPKARPALDLIQSVTSDDKLGLSTTCVQSLHSLAKGIQRRQVWALKFLETSAPSTSRFLNGYISDLGDYSECIKIQAQVEETKEPLKGKYCVLKVNLPLPQTYQRPHLPIQVNLSRTELANTFYEIFARDIRTLYMHGFYFGVCLPSGCSDHEIRQVINLKSAGTELDVNITECTQIENQVTKFKDQPGHRQFATYFMIFMLTVVLVSTFLQDSLPEGKLLDFCKCFSLSENTQKLVSVSQESSKLQFIHGLRFYFHILTLLGHLLVFCMAVPWYYSMFHRVEFKDWIWEEVLSNANAGISMFFFLSGFLNLYTFYPELERKNGKLSFISFAMVRWLRTTPALIGVILLEFVFAMDLKTLNPVNWEIARVMENGCVKNWHWNLVYLNNWLPVMDQCLFNTWSMSVDFQLYILSYFTICWLYSKPKWGIYSALFWIISGTVASSVQVWYYGIFPFAELLTARPEYFEALSNHFRTYNHLSAYFIGILIAYLSKTKSRTKNKLVLGLGSGLVFLCYDILYRIPHQWKVNGPNRVQEIIFAGLHRPMFVAFYAWIFYCFTSSSKPKDGVDGQRKKTEDCKNGSSEELTKTSMFKNLGIFVLLRKLLSLKIYVPFSRLTFALYLSENYFIGGDLMVNDRHFDVTTNTLIKSWLYLTFVSTIAAYFVYALFEAPFLNLMKMYYRKGGLKSQGKESQKMD